MREVTLWLLVLGLSFSASAFAQVSDGSEFNTDENGLALDGYDPVAYFTLGEATKGVPEYSAEHHGVTFYFASEQHLELFRQEPGRYLPAYGGWCAWAASRGSLATIDPESFLVHENRLYLNYNNRLNRRFGRALDENIESADANWPELSREASDR